MSQIKLRFIEAIQSAIAPVFGASLTVGDKLTDVFSKIQGLLASKTNRAVITANVTGGDSSTSDIDILSYTIPAGYQQLGDTYRCKINGAVTKPLSAGTTVSFWLKIETTKAISVTFTPTATMTNLPCDIEFTICTRSVSTTGTLAITARGTLMAGAATNITIIPIGVSATNIDTTAAMAVTIGFVFSNSNASNKVQAFTAEIMEV